MTTTINNEHKKLNAPNLRFPEFQGEWEESTIGEQFDLYSGNTPSRLNKEHFKGEINWISSGELKEHYIAETKEKISEEAAKSLKLLPIGTFVIAIYGLEADGVRGTGSITKSESTISQACMAFTSKGNVQNEFLYSWYKKHGNVIGIRYAQGTKQQNLSYDIIEKFHISYPTFQEQEKLNKFIALLDERIVTQSKVIDKLQSLIKGIGDELLYNKTWAKVYLKDIFAFYSTNSLSWDKLSDENESGIRNLHYGMIHNLNSTILDIKTMPFIKTGYIPQKYELCQYGDIAFADASEDTDEIAKAVEFRKISNEEQAVCGLHTIHGRDIHDMTVVGFKGYALNANYFHQQIKRMAQGTKVFSITASNISNCFVFLPSKDEQKKVVGILDAISLKIQVETEVLNSYKIQKQYLLRQMFI